MDTFLLVGLIVVALGLLVLYAWLSSLKQEPEATVTMVFQWVTMFLVFFQCTFAQGLLFFVVNCAFLWIFLLIFFQKRQK